MEIDPNLKNLYTSEYKTRIMEPHYYLLGC